MCKKVLLHLLYTCKRSDLIKGVLCPAPGLAVQLASCQKPQPGTWETLCCGWLNRTLQRRSPIVWRLLKMWILFSGIFYRNLLGPPRHMGLEVQNSFKEGPRREQYCKLTARHQGTGHVWFGDTYLASESLLPGSQFAVLLTSEPLFKAFMHF